LITPCITSPFKWEQNNVTYTANFLEEAIRKGNDLKFTGRYFVSAILPEMGLTCFFLKRDGNNWRLDNTGMQPQQPTGEINQDIIDRFETAMQQSLSGQ